MIVKPAKTNSSVVRSDLVGTPDFVKKLLICPTAMPTVALLEQDSRNLSEDTTMEATSEVLRPVYLANSVGSDSSFSSKNDSIVASDTFAIAQQYAVYCISSMIKIITEGVCHVACRGYGMDIMVTY